jgi:hypothetical protein
VVGLCQRPSQGPGRHVRAVHLVTRFFRSLGGAAPDPEQVGWLTAKLNPAERGHFKATSPPDQRHAVRCASSARELLGDAATDELVVASALHDVGKTEAGLGTVPRVLATVLIQLLRATRLDSWLEVSGWRGAVARYAHHPESGAVLLEAAGSAPSVVVWAREHHFDAADRSLAPDLAGPLAEADLIS